MSDLPGEENNNNKHIKSLQSKSSHYIFLTCSQKYNERFH